MNIFFIGDIVGRPGRRAVHELLPRVREEYGAELFLANAENAAGGSGLTPAVAEDLFGSGLHALTTGDHVWKNRAVYGIIQEERRILRPANYPPGTPGFGGGVIEASPGRPLGVINLQGRVFMQAVDCPFRAAERELGKLREECRMVLVDIHAEATSEKLALFHFLDGRVSAVLGTHTHVQTADERVSLLGTAYVTDVGMTGPMRSILGRDVDAVVRRFLTQMPQRLDVAGGDVQMHGVLLELEEASGRALSIRRLCLRLE